MDENERYVRERWESIATGSKALHLSRYCAPIVIWGNEFPNWQAAFAFTKAREEEIRQVEEEIMELQDDISCYHTGEHFYAIYGRILAREQSALAELQRGMKATR